MYKNKSLKLLTVIGFSGAPGTTLFSVQLNTEDEKVSYGGMLFDDVTGSQSQSTVMKLDV